MTKRLIVTADDFGLSRSLNAGILEAHRAGAITAASIVACGDAFEDAVALARVNPALDVGVHLTLDEERPIRSAFPTLVGADGRFHSRNRLVVLLSTGHVPLDEVEACWRDQIEHCLRAGLNPSFINSHGHIHAFPSLLPVACRLANEFGIPAIRMPIERLSIRHSGPAGFVKNILVTSSARYAFARRTSAAPAWPDRFVGLNCSGSLTAARLTKLLNDLEPGITELMTHPGYVDDDTRRRYGHWGYAWQAELKALLTVPPPRDVVVTTFTKTFWSPA